MKIFRKLPLASESCDIPAESFPHHSPDQNGIGGSCIPLYQTPLLDPSYILCIYPEKFSPLPKTNIKNVMMYKTKGKGCKSTPCHVHV